MLRRLQWALARWWMVRKLVKVGMPKQVAREYVNTMRVVSEYDHLVDKGKGG